MIGGTDILIENPGVPAAQVLDSLGRCIRNRWPNAVFHDAEGRRLGNYQAVSFGRASELFVYRDERAAASWELLGADPSNENQMIHLLADDVALTMVMDDPENADMKAIRLAANEVLRPSNAWGFGMAA